MNTTTSVLQELRSNPLIQALSIFAKARGVQLYLLGGSVRDLLLNRPIVDFDFALASDAIQFAKTFAESLGATCIALEEKPPTARVIVKTPGTSMDFAQFRDASLIDDLRLRDLTINAMAIALESISSSSPIKVIDPCGGRDDLATRILQFPSEQVVREDPLRLMRIYRFAAQLDFEISQNAISLAQKYHRLLPHVSAERQRDELMKILSVERARPYLQKMCEVKLLAHVMPSVGQAPMSWQPLEIFEDTPIPAPIRTYQTEIDAYLNGELGLAVNRRSLIKLCLFLQGSLAEIGKQLRLSRKVVKFMKCLVWGHQQLTKKQLTQKQIIHFMRTTASDWWGVLLFSTAMHPIDAAMLRQIADTYYRHVLPILNQGKLITGEDLIRTFNMKQGKEIGMLLKQIEERQFDGEIRTREEAFAAVEALIRQ